MLLAPLERELQRKLNDARADRGRIDRAKLAVGRVCAGISELWVVERVEKFGAELQRSRLADGDLLREARSLQFRAEFFNTFNHPQFANPSTNAANSQFGAINSTSVSPRIIQFALKFAF